MKKAITMLLTLALILGSAACVPEQITTGTTPPQTTVTTSLTQATQTTQATQSIPATEPVHLHSYREDITAPTCTQRGQTLYTCGCGDSYTVYSPATGHQWDAGSLLLETPYERRSFTCQSCGQQEDLYLLNGQPYTPRKGNSDYGYHYFATDPNGLQLQALYLRLVEACEAFLTDTRNLDADTAQLAIPCGDLDVSFYEFWSVLKIFYLENPQYYWLKDTFRQPFRGYYYLDISEEYYLNTQRQEANAAIEAMEQACAALLTDRMTQTEKAQLIHDYIRLHMNYCYNASTGKPETAIWAHNLLGCAMMEEGVCEAYAKTYSYLCLCNGVNCLIVTGSYGGYHAWNYVELESGWYCTDCTFDDRLNGYSFYGMSKISAEQHRQEGPGEHGLTYLYALPTLSQEDLTFQTILIPSTLTAIPAKFYVNIKGLTHIVIPENVTRLEDMAFLCCSELEWISIPASVTYLGERCLGVCEALTDIYYGGTMAQWEAIEKVADWDLGSDEYTIHCTDGDIS